MKKPMEFEFAIFAKSLLEQIAKEELSIISTMHKACHLRSRKNWGNVGGSPSTALRVTPRLRTGALLILSYPEPETLNDMIRTIDDSIIIYSSRSCEKSFLYGLLDDLIICQRYLIERISRHTPSGGGEKKQEQAIKWFETLMRRRSLRESRSQV